MVLYGIHGFYGVCGGLGRVPHCLRPRLVDVHGHDSSISESAEEMPGVRARHVGGIT